MPTNSADSPEIDKVFARCQQFLKELDGGTMLDQQIHTRITYANGHVLKGAAPIQTGDLEIMAKVFVHMNRDLGEIPGLTKPDISGIPNEGGGSQLVPMGIDPGVHFAALKAAKDEFDKQLDVNRECLKIIANLTELLKQRG